MITYVGLDLSLTSTGGVALPAGWAGHFSLLERMNVGRALKESASLLEKAKRVHDVAGDIVAWVLWLAGNDASTVRVWYEDPPRMGAYNAHLIVGLAAVLQDHLSDYSIALEPLNQTSARVTLLGRLPPAGERKREAVAAARAMSGGNRTPLESDDEADALVTLNHGLSLVGEYFLALPRRPQSEREKRARTGSAAFPRAHGTTTRTQRGARTAGVSAAGVGAR